MKAYENTNLSAKERAELLLKELSLDEKMAQVNCYFFQPTAKSVEERCPYGIGVVSALEMRPFKTLEECAALQRDLQKRVMALSPHHIPAIFHMEGVCGLLVQDAVSLPGPIGRGAAFDPALEEELGRVVGKEASALCISHIFAPVLDVTRDARFGRMNESYGEDETLVSSLGTAYTRGLQDNEGKKVQIEGVAKHFLAFHKGAGGLHGAEVSISERELRDVYAKPFEAAIRLAELKGIMPCYNTVNGEFVSYSSHYLRDLLRGELGFEGVTVSDYCAVQNGVVTNHVAATPVEAGLRAIKGGMDVEQQFPYGYNDELKQMFASGELDISLLDEAVLRVLEAKFRMGLFEHPFASENYSEAFKDENAKALTLRCAEESLVLLKNNGILPLAKKYNKIAVVGYHAGTVRGMFGGYTHLSMTEGLIAMTGTMAGVDGGSGVRQEDCYPGCKVLREDAMFDEFESLARHIHPDCDALYKGLKAAFPESEVVYARGFDYAGDGESGFEEALEICKDADLVILALGGKNGTGSMNTMGENVNGINIGLPPRAGEVHPPCSTAQKAHGGRALRRQTHLFGCGGRVPRRDLRVLAALRGRHARHCQRVKGRNFPERQAARHGCPLRRAASDVLFALLRLRLAFERLLRRLRLYRQPPHPPLSLRVWPELYHVRTLRLCGFERGAQSGRQLHRLRHGGEHGNARGHGSRAAVFL